MRNLARGPLPGRFWSRVQKSPGCWLWTGSKMSFGYGILHVQKRAISAHRYSYQLANGAIPDGMVVRHSCDVPACVNPLHLVLGTQQENLRDMLDRGRQFSLYRGATHCRHGHEFTYKNTGVDSSGKRRCRECCRLRQQPKNAERSRLRIEARLGR